MGSAGREWVRWTKARKAQLIESMMLHCNIDLAAKDAGVPARSVYNLRRKDPQFAEEFRSAIAAGYEVMEARLVAHVLEGGGKELTDAAGITLDVDTALRMLAHHRATAQGATKQTRGGARPQRASDEDTDRAILQKLALIERRLAQKNDGA